MTPEFGSASYLASNGQEVRFEFANLEDWTNVLCQQNTDVDTVVVNGVTINRSQITDFEWPRDITAIPANMLRKCTKFNKPVKVPKTVTSIAGSFLAYCDEFNSPVELPDGLITIAGGFLRNSPKFNQPIVIPDSVTTIGNTFMDWCVGFNSPIKLSDNLMSVGTFFLGYCQAFNQNITFPASLATFDASLLYDCKQMVSTITVLCSGIPDSTYALSIKETSSSPACQQGIKLTGSQAQRWKNALPDRAYNPYRKLIVV